MSLLTLFSVHNFLSFITPFLFSIFVSFVTFHRNLSVKYAHVLGRIAEATLEATMAQMMIMIIIY